MTTGTQGQVGCRTMSPDEADKIFFSNLTSRVATAKALCAECPARDLCTILGVTAEFGIFGGLTPEERDARWPGRLEDDFTPPRIPVS